mmetsp:Transcript_27666/g.44252  ORF Transcript_27666/g.44252 Transcript_27666/m.44252 type:complete len:500 (-) Transcript_27666:1120-2619(-)
MKTSPKQERFSFTGKTAVSSKEVRSDMPRIESTDSVEDNFKVSDLLVWSGSTRGRTPGYDEKPNTRLAFEGLEFDKVSLFYCFCAYVCLVLAESTLRTHLESSGISLIVSVQRRFPGNQWYADLFGFPPDIWGIAPALLLCTIQTWRTVGYRMVILQGFGKMFKWLNGLFFHQGRPFWVNSKVEMLHCPTFYGFPSGHALLLLVCIAPIIELLWETRMIQPANSRREKPVYVSRFHGIVSFCASFFLLGLYLICMFGRMYLGTHFLHSILFGTICGMLLLQVFTKENVSKIADRVMVPPDEYDGQPNGAKFVELAVRATLAALLILAVAYGSLYASNSLCEPDPKVWTTRALQHCDVGPDTREGSIDQVYSAGGLIVGWVVSLALLGMDKVDKDDGYTYWEKEKNKKNPFFESRKASFVNYGTLLDREEAALTDGTINDTDQVRLYSRTMTVVHLMAIIIQLMVSMSIAVYLPSRFFGLFLAVVLSMYVYPAYIQHWLV